MSRLTTSKFRNLKGGAFKREAWYPDLNVSNSTTEGTIVAASPLWIAVLWGTPTGGSLGVLGHGDFGKRKRNVPLIHAHPQPVNDFQWNPYFDWHLATASTDATVKLWKLPEDGLADDLTVPDATLKGHGKRVDVLQWHPTACNVLASGGGDNTVRIWDTSAEQDKLVIEGFKDAIWGLAWNYDGSLLAVTSKDKKIRLVDPRAKSFVQVIIKLYSRLINFWS